MKNKVLKVFLTVIIILCGGILLNNSYAASVCTIKGFFSPNNPSIGQEVKIEISATQINEGINELKFNLEYDLKKFELESVNANNKWNVIQTENLFEISTKNHEVTTETGKIITIFLKVKNNTSISSTTIKLSNITVTTEDEATVKIGDIEQEISINENAEPQDKNTIKDENVVVPENTIKKEEGKTDIDNTSIENSNKIQITNENGSLSKNNIDSSTTNKILPKTGINNIIEISIILTIIVIISSYIAYRKYYKN